MKSAMEMLRGCDLWNRRRQAKGQDHTRQQFAKIWTLFYLRSSMKLSSYNPQQALTVSAYCHRHCIRGTMTVPLGRYSCASHDRQYRLAVGGGSTTV